MKNIQNQITKIKKTILKQDLSNKSIITYNKLNEIDHSLYRYEQLSKAGLKNEAKAEKTRANNLINNFNSSENGEPLNGYISNTKYIWIASSNSCEACQELDGTEYDSIDDIPDKPHANCNCYIEEVAENDGDADEEMCDGVKEVEQNLEDADEASGEIESINEDSEINGDEIISLVDEIQSFSEKVEDAREELIEMIESSEFAQEFTATFSGLLTPIDISMALTLGQDVLYVVNEVIASYQIFEDYKDQLQVLRDAGLCDECTDKFYHANANYDCTKRSEVGEITAKILSVLKEIWDLIDKISHKKMTAQKAWDDSMGDLKADWYGIQKAKEQMNSEKDLKMSEIRDIFMPKK